MEIEPKVSERMQLRRGGLELRLDAPDGSAERIVKATRIVARQLGDGVAQERDGRTVWSREEVAVELQPQAAGVAIFVREDWSPMLRQAFVSGLGFGFVNALGVFGDPRRSRAGCDIEPCSAR